MSPRPSGPERQELRRALSALRSGLEASLSRDLTRVSGTPPSETSSGAFAAADESRFVALYDVLRQRLASLAASPRRAEIDDFGLDADALESARSLLDFLFDRYWRVDVEGEERLPERGPCLFVANRSGLLPYDGLMLAHALARARPDWARPRALLGHTWMRLPFVQPSLVRIGAVRDLPENLERLLATGRSAIFFPEEEDAARRTYRERHRLQGFRCEEGIRAAGAVGVPIVPIALVGAEEAHPILYKAESSLVRRVGLPFLPITPTFPWLGPLGLIPLPTRWRIRIGAPLGAPTEHAGRSETLELARTNEALRTQLHTLLTKTLAERDADRT